MALVHTNVTVGTTPTLLLTMPNGVGYRAVQVNNRDTAGIFLGDANITAASGANGGQNVATNTTVQVWLSGGDKLYAISAAGTTTGAVSILYSGI